MDISTSGLTEEEYIAHLNHERHMFAWCLEHIGRLPADLAAQKALGTYPYEPPSKKYRWLKFHDEAWHWAMLHLFGEMYWISNPRLETPSTEYVAESKHYDISSK